MREGVLGEIREAHVSVLGAGALDPSAPLHWRERQDYSGMNVMAYGIYTEVIGRWLGDTKRVMADGAVFVRSRIDEETGQPHAIDVPDSLGVLATMASGARVSYRFSNVAHTTAPGTNGVTILGSLGTLVWSMNDKIGRAHV